jgi:hypothetical protein
MSTSHENSAIPNPRFIVSEPESDSDWSEVLTYDHSNVVFTPLEDDYTPGLDTPSEGERITPGDLTTFSGDGASEHSIPRLREYGANDARPRDPPRVYHDPLLADRMLFYFSAIMFVLLVPFCLYNTFGSATTPAVQVAPAPTVTVTADFHHHHTHTIRVTTTVAAPVYFGTCTSVTHTVSPTSASTPAPASAPAPTQTQTPTPSPQQRIMGSLGALRKTTRGWCWKVVHHHPTILLESRLRQWWTPAKPTEPKESQIHKAIAETNEAIAEMNRAVAEMNDAAEPKKATTEKRAFRPFGRLGRIG